MKTLLALLLCLLAPACKSMAPPPPDWIEREFAAPSENVVWEVVRRSMNRMQFPQGAGMDRGALRAESGWLPKLSPFKDQGFRLRAVVEIRPVREGVYTVRAHVQRQKNSALVNPGDPRYAEWKWEDDDIESARILLQHVRTYLDGEVPAGEA